MDLKETLKALKLNESTISMILGAIVVLVVGVLVFNFIRSRGGEGGLLPGLTTQKEEVTTTLPTKHTVAQGEHLWLIAEKYYKSGYNWVDVAQENNLTNANFLAVGQGLTIPSVPTRPATVDGVTVFGPAIENTTYTVIQGDHLWGIAVRAYGDGYKWPELAKANNLANPNLISPGQNLSIPR